MAYANPAIIAMKLKPLMIERYRDATLPINEKSPDTAHKSITYFV